MGQGITSRGFRPGEALSARLPASAEDIVLETPDGERIAQEPIDPALWSWGPLRTAGVYTLTWEQPDEDEPQHRAFAVNLLSPTEGDIAVVETIHLGSEEVGGISADDATYTPLWPWALATCMGLLLIEWWVFHRKALI
jgi:hypothetical protein